MKRCNSSEPDDVQKRSKSSLRWLGAGLEQLKSCSSADSWHAAKQLVAESAVNVTAYVEDVVLGCVGISGHVTQVSDNATAFPHLVPPPALAAQQSVAVQLVLHPSTGQLLDAATSCCPGGFQPVLGSFCPCATALLLCAAKQASAPSQGIKAMEGLPAWEGSTLQDVLRSQRQHSSSSVCQAGQQQQQQQEQEGLQRVQDALVAHPTCFTGGLGLEPWQFEGSVTATAAVHVASQRNPGVYGYNTPRAAPDPNKLSLIEDAAEDLSSHPWFQNAGFTAMQHLSGAEPEPTAADGSGAAAPAGTAAERAAAAEAAAAEALPNDIRRALMSAGVPVSGAAAAAARSAGAAHGLEEPGSAKAAAAAAAAARQRSPAVARRQLVTKAVQQWLATYNGEALAGWVQRPKVVNDAFDLLSGTGGTPGRPLSALVLLLRAEWEYLHTHGLGRLLAKPFKLLMAMRSVLLVGSIPLWARKAVCCQLEVWERGLLWQHAATPLDAIGGNVALVHLLGVIKEVKQLCLHHWDEPHLCQLLSEAFAEQHSDTHPTHISSSSQQPPSANSSGSSGSSDVKVAAWAVEPPSLLQLRLQALDAMGASGAYLELAMAGGAWREAINRLLTSKERSQLLKAVKLLTRHITSLPERLKYMSQIVTLDSLGAPERLEVTARLLLDLREQLHPTLQPVKPSPKNLARAASSSATATHMWKVTMWSLHQDATAPSADAHNGRLPRAVSSATQQREQQELQLAWSKFLKLFLHTAAGALFAAGEASIKAHSDHLKEEGLMEAQDTTGTGTAAAAAAAEGGAGTSGAAQGADAAGPSSGHRPAERRVHVTSFICPACNSVHAQEEPFDEPMQLGPQPGDPDWKLLAVDEALFANTGAWRAASIPVEAVKGSFTSRSPAGYLNEQRVIDAYKKVVPPSFPQLLPLCGLDALCISSISSNIMQDFDAGGKLDTSLGVEPLRELLGHPVVEMGPGPVRLQAAIEAVVYASAMTPLALIGDTQLDSFYRQLLYQLLGVGQRPLALLVSRARYKVAPSPQAAGELLDVAIASSPEAQSAAVDLILGKGSVCPLLPEDDAVIRELEGKPAGAAAAGRDGDGLRPGGGGVAPAGLTATELALLQREARQGLLLGLSPYAELHELMGFDPGEFSDEYSDDYYSSDDSDMYDDHPYGIHRAVRALADAQRHAEAALAEAAAASVAANEAAAAGEQHSGRPQDVDLDSMSISEGGSMSGSEGSHGEDADGEGEGDGSHAAANGAAAAARAEALAEGKTEQAAARVAARAYTQVRAAERSAQRQRRAGGAAAAADAAAAEPQVGSKRPREAAGSSRGAGSSAAAAAAAAGGIGSHHHTGAHGSSGEGSEDDDGLASFNTRELLGADAAAALQLRDTASSRGAAAAAAAAAGGGAAGGAGGGGGEGGADRPRALGMWHAIDDDADDYYYGRHNGPMRNMPPAQPAARPTRQPRKRHHAAAAAAAAAGGAGSSRGGAAGGGGGGGGDDPAGGEGGSSHGGRRGHRRHPHSRPSSRNRRSGSVDGYADSAQQTLVAELFGISPLSHSHPLRTLRVHIHRLAGVQLWAVTKYAAGRGADKLQLQRLGMAAWLSDGNTTGSSTTQTLRLSEALRWCPVATDRAGWMDATRQLRDVVNANLSAPPYEPYGGQSVASRSWSGLPCASWDLFVAQQRYPSSYNSTMQHHDTPDANLAWLMAMLSEPDSSSNSSGSGSNTARNAGSSLDSMLPKPSPQQQQQQQVLRPPQPSTAASLAGRMFPAHVRSALDGMLANTQAVLHHALSSAAAAEASGTAADLSAVFAYLALPYEGELQGYTYRSSGPEGPGYYEVEGLAGGAGGGTSSAAAAAAAAAGSSGGGAGSSGAVVPANAEAGTGAAGGGGGGGGGDDGVAELLKQLACISKGIRFGLPMLQLCHALMQAGCRDACLELLPQALLPQSGTLLSLQLNAPLVLDMQELLPLVAKHGDSSLRVAAAVSYMLVTRRALPAPLINQTDVLSGLLSWWLGLSSALNNKPEEWGAEQKAADLRDFFSPTFVPPVAMRANNWPQLQRMLIQSILTSLGGKHRRHSPLVPYGGSDDSSSKDPNVLSAAEGYQLLLQCEAVKEAHWAFRLYLARVCYHMRLAPSWPALSSLLCPALSAAAAEHTSGWSAEDKEPLADLRAWKEHRNSRLLPAASSRARQWVAETLEWLATEVLVDQDRAGPALTVAAATAGAAAGDADSSMPYSTFLGAAADASVAEKDALRKDFVDTLSATLSGWYGPELLLLAAAMRPPHSTLTYIKPICSPRPAAAAAAAAAAAITQEPAATAALQQQLGSLPALLQAGLLPCVARADELSSSNSVRRGLYRSSLRVLMADRQLLGVLPQELVRCLALTYWQQEATPEGFLKANEVLLRLEGADAAQTLSLPGATSSSKDGDSNAPATAAAAAAAAAGSSAANAGMLGLQSMAAGLRSFVSGGSSGGGEGGGSGSGGGGASMPQVHAVLLEQLDLVPSKGGIEAAGLRFMQLQRHAAKGDHAAALEAMFRSESGTSSSEGAASLCSHMEVVDAVLRLAADASSGNEALRSLMQCAPYQAIVGLEDLAACSDEGVGEQLLAQLSTGMQQHVLKLCIWRLVRNILHRAPPVELRHTLGPRFVQARGMHTYTVKSPPQMPSYLTPEVMELWVKSSPFNSLYGYCRDLGLVEAATVRGDELARLLCSQLQQQELALMWALQRLTALLPGPEVESTLLSLTSSQDRLELGKLPVLMLGLGESLKAGGDRKMMWAYATIKRTGWVDKIQRYMRIKGSDVETLKRYLSKSTIAELQGHKATILPWASWEFGSKANQAQELAEWLNYYSTTWPNARVAAGLARDEPSGFPLY